MPNGHRVEGRKWLSMKVTSQLGDEPKGNWGRSVLEAEGTVMQRLRGARLGGPCRDWVERERRVSRKVYRDHHRAVSKSSVTVGWREDGTAQAGTPVPVSY